MSSDTAHQAGLAPVPEVDPVAGRRLVDAGALLLDVREPDEYAEAHVGGATLLPLGQLGARLGEFPHDRTVVVICRSGRRSGEAVRTMQAAGFGNAVNLAGGMIAWREAGLPVEA